MPIGPRINPAAYPTAKFFPLLSVIQVPITPNTLATANIRIMYVSMLSPYLSSEKVGPINKGASVQFICLGPKMVF